MSDASTNITKPKTSSAERKQVEGPSAKTKSLRSQNAPSSVPWMQCLRLLLRSVGLGIACIIHGSEPRKPLFHKSRRAVLAGSAVHILPAAVSACLLTYNIRGYFIGRELEGANSQDDLKLGALQISAKLQELLITASLGSIILNVIRRHLVLKDGVPLGLLGSDKAFAQVSFFWSVEFWGGVRSFRNQKWGQNIFLVGLLVVSGGLTLLAGPATAVLMIPRMMNLPTGGSIFWLNGSESQLWPAVLDADLLLDHDCSADQARLHDFACPSAGFLPLYSHYSRRFNFVENLYKIQLQDNTLTKNMFVAGAYAEHGDTWAYTTHAPSAVLETAAVSFYRDALLSLRATRPGVAPYPANWVLAQTWKWYLKTQVPVVRVACIGHDPLRLIDEIMLENMRFPKLDTYSLYGEKKKPAASVTIDVREAVMTYFITNGLITANTSIALLEQQVPNSLVIPIESRAGSASSLALFVIRNTTGFDGSSRELAASTCTVDARWAKGHSVIESKGGGLVDQVLSYDFYGSQSRSIVDTELASDEIPFSWGEYHPKRPGLYKAIQIRRSWYEMLSPRVTDASISGGAADNSNTEGSGIDNFFTPSLLERMVALAHVPSVNATNSGTIHSQLAYLEVLFSTFFADGISRAAMPRHIDTWRFFPAWEYGHWNDSSESVYRTMIRSGDPVETFPQPAALQGRNGTRMVVKAVFTAYAMKIQGWFDWASAVVLLLHAIVAIAYTLWCLWEGQVGEGWDTIPELLALSQQSAPADGGVLSNTCAGVRTMRTMEAVAVVENHSDSFNGLVNFGKEELCLRFRHPWDTRVPGTALMEDNKYGALRVG